jgi:hypothetical protein
VDSVTVFVRGVSRRSDVSLTRFCKKDTVQSFLFPYEGRHLIFQRMHKKISVKPQGLGLPELSNGIRKAAVLRERAKPGELYRVATPKVKNHMLTDSRHRSPWSPDRQPRGPISASAWLSRIENRSRMEPASATSIRNYDGKGRHRLICLFLSRSDL